MIRTIDTQLFCYIIGDEDAGAGAEKLELIEEEGLEIQYYLGPSGKKVGILITDEFTDQRTATDILRLLGMQDLVPRMFPPVDEIAEEGED